MNSTDNNNNPLNSQGNLVNNPENKNIAVPIIEERLTADKRWVETGRVTVSKQVHSENETINVPVVHEEIEVRRVERNQYIDSAPQVREENGTTIIPVLKEVLVVEKKLMLVEEVHITKRRVEHVASQNETVRKEELIINRSDNNPTT